MNVPTSVPTMGAMSVRAGDLRGRLNISLHEMSQPLTALLCMLEYSKALETAEEMKEILGSGVEQCERLMESVRDMQTQVLDMPLLHVFEQEGEKPSRLR